MEEKSNIDLAVPPLKRWLTEQQGEVRQEGIFKLQHVDRRSPRTGRVGTYQVLHLASWVNVVALTDDDQVVLVEQFRHGIDDFALEIPGGMIEAGEEPSHAAARELL